MLLQTDDEAEDEARKRQAVPEVDVCIVCVVLYFEHSKLTHVHTNPLTNPFGYPFSPHFTSLPFVSHTQRDSLIPSVVAQVDAARATLPAGFTVRGEEFEKDDDSNFHIDFIASFGNLRCTHLPFL